jgi:hypothetical protein
MLSGRTVSIDTIIEQLQDEYGFEKLNKYQVAEWVWKSMALIGTPYPYEDKAIEREIIDYRAELPVDLYSIEGVREQTTGIPMREMTNVFHMFPDSSITDAAIVQTGDLDTDLETQFETIVGPFSASDYYTYKTQGNYIFVGFDAGYIEMAYKAIPTDIITGMPTIPDDAAYIRGVVDFIAERLAFKLMLKDQLSERKYEIIRQNYLFNIGAARSRCLLPDSARMEVLVNRWKSIYLGSSNFDEGFKFLGSRE